MHRKPDFLIVGAAKCGTTSLFEYLRQHPDIFMPACKEISFFCGSKYSDEMDAIDYFNYFNKAKNNQITGEASVAYLYPENCPQRIAETLGNNVKIIIILRNPVDMVYSLWNHNCKTGQEHLPFLKAIEEEENRMRDARFLNNISTWPYNFAYISRATYTPQVERYLNIFGKNNVKIYIFEDFFLNIETSLVDVYRFLGVNEKFKLSNYKIYNKAGTPRSVILQKFYSEKHILTDPIRAIIPIKARRNIVKFIARINTKKSTQKKLNGHERAKLINLFIDSIISLENILGITLDNWKTIY